MDPKNTDLGIIYVAVIIVAVLVTALAVRFLFPYFFGSDMQVPQGQKLLENRTRQQLMVNMSRDRMFVIVVTVIYTLMLLGYLYLRSYSGLLSSDLGPMDLMEGEFHTYDVLVVSILVLGVIAYLMYMYHTERLNFKVLELDTQARNRQGRRVENVEDVRDAVVNRGAPKRRLLSDFDGTRKTMRKFVSALKSDAKEQGRQDFDSGYYISKYWPKMKQLRRRIQMAEESKLGSLKKELRDTRDEFMGEMRQTNRALQIEGGAKKFRADFNI